MSDKLRYPGRRDAVDADGKGLRERRSEGGAIDDRFAVGDVGGIAAGEADPDRDLGPGGKGFRDGACFVKRGNGFETKQIGGFRIGDAGEDLDALAVEAYEITVGAVVVAVVLGAIMESRAIRAQRGGDENAARGKFRGGGAGDGDGVDQGGVGAFWREAALGIALARNLVAASGDALSAGGNIGAMHGGNFFGLIFEDVGGPERAIDAGAEIFEFGSEAAIDDTDAAED